MKIYRAYDKSWNRTGYSSTPLYSGQMPLADNKDTPAKCPTCGKPIVAFSALPEPLVRCENKHFTKEEQITL